MTHEWRARVIRQLNDIDWDDPDLAALPIDKQEAIETIIEQTCQALCEVAGHEPERDQCGRPEHDYCLWCQKRMPGAAQPAIDARKAKDL